MLLLFMIKVNQHKMYQLKLQQMKNIQLYKLVKVKNGNKIQQNLLRHLKMETEKLL